MDDNGGVFPARSLKRVLAACLVLAGVGTVTGNGAEAVGGPAHGTHWAYRGLPSRVDGPPVAGVVDAAIAGELAKRGLEPAGEADRATLCRRLHIVLTGLPPTPGELASFLADASPDPVGRRADELLGSPRFGEHWARHWLDVVRYADSVTLRGFVFREAWRYRDYVVEALNGDRPFDEFVREQVAGDLLPGEGLELRRRRLVATTFWALGDTNLEEQDKRQLELDVIDEQLDVLGKAFLAQTVSCARCHDHKFDPIPTRDYHALAGILSGTRLLKHANVSEWIESPLPGSPEEEEAWKAADARVARLESELKEVKATIAARSQQAGAGPLGGIVVDDAQARLVGEWTVSTHNKPYVGDGYRHDGNTGKGTKTATFHPVIPRTGEYEVRLAYTPGENRATNVPVTIFSADGERVALVNQTRKPDIDGRLVSLGRARFEKDGAGFVLVSNEGTTGHVIADAVQLLSVEGPAEGLAREGAGKAGEPGEVSAARALEKSLEQQLASARTTSRRPRYMAPVEAGATNLPVLRRGNWRNQGEVVPRGVLTVAFRAGEPVPATGASGRLELAEWVVHRDNPLTARVFVNRAWHWVFGAGLVRSVDNFGTTGDAPTHPELLDGLAARFMTDGWSVKRLLRALVTSAAFRRSSDPGDPRVQAAIALDPENRWLARFAMRQVEAEVMRDAMLLAGDGLSVEGFGKPPFPPGLAADYGHVSDSRSRSLYLPVFRNARPEGLVVFDAADPSRVAGAREASTIAPQALYLLNNRFVSEQASRLGAVASKAGDPVGEIWLRALGRTPAAGERRAAEEHVRTAADRHMALAEIAQAVFGSVDFRRIQ